MSGAYERTPEHRRQISERTKGRRLSPAEIEKRTQTRIENGAGLYGKHGHGATGKRTPTYNSWDNMIQRCTNKNRPEYKHYGGRGITVNPRWLGKEGFQNFLEDMGERPDGLTLDRIDNSQGYSPNNCRWADRETQLANRRIRIYTQKDTVCHPDRRHFSLGMCESCYCALKQGRIPRAIEGTDFEEEFRMRLAERRERKKL